jgi:hypothetical protein
MEAAEPVTSVLVSHLRLGPSSVKREPSIEADVSVRLHMVSDSVNVHILIRQQCMLCSLDRLKRRRIRIQ